MNYRAMNRNFSITFETSDGIVTKASAGFEWAKGKTVYGAIKWCQDKRMNVELLCEGRIYHIQELA